MDIKLREFARSRPLILLSSDEPLFKNLRDSIQQYPHAQVIERTLGEPGEWIDPEKGAIHYNSSVIRRQWSQISSILDRDKVAVNSAQAVTGLVGERAIDIQPTEALSEDVPVLVTTTYHPGWQREDRDTIYAASPFFMLTFVRHNTRIVYTRQMLDWMGLLVTAITSVFLCCLVFVPHLRRPLGMYRSRNREGRNGIVKGQRVVSEIGTNL